MQKPILAALPFARKIRTGLCRTILISFVRFIADSTTTPGPGLTANTISSGSRRSISIRTSFVMTALSELSFFSCVMLPLLFVSYPRTDQCQSRPCGHFQSPALPGHCSHARPHSFQDRVRDDAAHLLRQFRQVMDQQRRRLLAAQVRDRRQQLQHLGIELRGGVLMQRAPPLREVFQAHAEQPGVHRTCHSISLAPCGIPIRLRNDWMCRNAALAASSKSPLATAPTMTVTPYARVIFHIHSPFTLRQKRTRALYLR